eukprot:scaffold988_cov165-Ochromonas_danica.AAC.60
MEQRRMAIEAWGGEDKRRRERKASMDIDRWRDLLRVKSKERAKKPNEDSPKFQVAVTNFGPNTDQQTPTSSSSSSRTKRRQPPPLLSLAFYEIPLHDMKQLH